MQRCETVQRVPIEGPPSVGAGRPAAPRAARTRVHVPKLAELVTRCLRRSGHTVHARSWPRGACAELADGPGPCAPDRVVGTRKTELRQLDENCGSELRPTDERGSELSGTAARPASDRPLHPISVYGIRGRDDDRRRTRSVVSRTATEPRRIVVRTPRGRDRPRRPITYQSAATSKRPLRGPDARPRDAQSAGAPPTVFDGNRGAGGGAWRRGQRRAATRAGLGALESARSGAAGTISYTAMRCN